MTAALRPPTRWPPTRPCTRSYEDRPGAPDRVFAALDDAATSTRSTPGRASWPSRRRRARRPAPPPPHPDQRGGRAGRAARAGRRPPARHGAADARGGRRPLAAPRGLGERMRRWAARCERLIVLSRPHVAAPAACSASTRGAAWSSPTASTPRSSTPPRRPPRLLAPAPRREAAGWAPGEARAPSATPRTTCAASPADGPVLLYVGRFTAVKRLPLLIEAYAPPGRASPAPRRWSSSAASPASGRASTRSRRSAARAREDVFLPAGTRTAS